MKPGAKRGANKMFCLETIGEAMGRFMSCVEVNKETGCHEWTGFTSKRFGYAQFGYNRKKHRAHRWLYQQLNGPLPRNIDVCHKCDNRKCVNPDHLFVGPRSLNMQDCFQKGRAACQKSDWLRVVARGVRVGGSKLNDDIVREMRRRYKNGETYAAIASDFGIHTASAWNAIKGKTWSHVK